MSYQLCCSKVNCISYMLQPPILNKSILHLPLQYCFCLEIYFFTTITFLHSQNIFYHEQSVLEKKITFKNTIKFASNAFLSATFINFRNTTLMVIYLIYFENKSLMSINMFHSTKLTPYISTLINTESALESKIQMYLYETRIIIAT